MKTAWLYFLLMFYTWSDDFISLHAGLLSALWSVGGFSVPKRLCSALGNIWRSSAHWRSISVEDVAGWADFYSLTYTWSSLRRIYSHTKRSDLIATAIMVKRYKLIDITGLYTAVLCTLNTIFSSYKLYILKIGHC